MFNDDDQLTNSTAAPADRQSDEHRATADEWLQRVIAGIQQMHRDENARREVAQRLF
jgi:hypothetical protein